MKLALITPTRGDRPLFEKQYNNIIKNQTVQPDEVIIIDYPPVNKEIMARDFFTKAVKASNDLDLGPYIALAESVSITTQNKNE